MRGHAIRAGPSESEMDFFERQASARRHTRLLELYFALAVIGTVLMVYLVVVVVADGSRDSRHRLRYPGYNAPGFQDRLLESRNSFWRSSVVTVAFILCGSAFKTMQLAGGGGVVAEMLGGRAIDANTANPDERKLLNVVEEMAIASGTPVPHVYVHGGGAGNQRVRGRAFDERHGDLRDARLPCNRLTRDELQGVDRARIQPYSQWRHAAEPAADGIDIRHSLPRVVRTRADADYQLPRRAAGTTAHSLRCSSAGCCCCASAASGVFFAKLIKSAISRQREILADASSVQFTRNPAGLAGALKKVGGCGSRIEDRQRGGREPFLFRERHGGIVFGNVLHASAAGGTHPRAGTELGRKISSRRNSRTNRRRGQGAATWQSPRRAGASNGVRWPWGICRAAWQWGRR